MSFLNNLYYKSLAENQNNIRFWEGYLNDLKALDFSVYQDKLKVPALVPIGKRIYFRGEIKHTNEVTAALGAGYFAKCSLKQAEVLRQHRIKDAQTKLNTFLKEKEYIENQLLFKNQNLFEDKGQEIIEVCTDEEDKMWREKHRKNVRKYKQSHKNNEDVKTDITDEELWNRLEELELQEELENELGGNEDDSSSNDSFIVKDEDSIKILQTEQEENNEKKDSNNTQHTNSRTTYKTNNDSNHDATESTRLELLEKILNKQNELEDKLFELKNKEKSKIKTEEDLISKLDEMEELEELEDDMERIEDILESEDVEVAEENKSYEAKSNRRVSFANEEDDEPVTLELTFKHSNVEPCKKPYDSKIGIVKPSDIYEAFSHLFVNETTSILKKTKYNKNTDLNPPPKAIMTKAEEVPEIRETIVVNDVVDKSVVNTVPEIQKEKSKPQSLFKRQRQQMKFK